MRPLPAGEAKRAKPPDTRDAPARPGKLRRDAAARATAVRDDPLSALLDEIALTDEQLRAQHANTRVAYADHERRKSFAVADAVHEADQKLGAGALNRDAIASSIAKRSQASVQVGALPLVVVERSGDTVRVELMVQARR
jgi:hypothetical protein